MSARRREFTTRQYHTLKRMREGNRLNSNGAKWRLSDGETVSARTAAIIVAGWVCPVRPTDPVLAGSDTAPLMTTSASR